MQISRRIKSLNRSNKTELEVLQMQIKLNKASMLLIKFVSTSSSSASSASSTSSIVIIKIYLHFEGFHFKNTHTHAYTHKQVHFTFSLIFIYIILNLLIISLIWYDFIPYSHLKLYPHTRTFLHIFKMSLIWFYLLWIATNYIGKNVGKHLQNHKKLNSFQIRSWDLLIDCIFSNDFVSSISFLITKYFQICFYSSFV